MNINEYILLNNSKLENGLSNGLKTALFGFLYILQKGRFWPFSIQTFVFRFFSPWLISDTDEGDIIQYNEIYRNSIKTRISP